MSYNIMKDYSNYLTDKPFSCDVDGCSMKFTNENHLTVHKKRHDMTLNLGLGPKGTTFTDQTPTPTQFIRNCEEVGLFQDLQNVNPFEETFKKAVEAAKSGQPFSLDKPFQSNQSDDTLHTPNIFPHITDVPNLNHSDTILRSENIPPCEDGLLKQDLSENGKICSANITEEVVEPAVLPQPLVDSTTPLGNVSNLEHQSVEENKVILKVPEGHFVQLITPDNSQSSCKMVVIKNSVNEVFPSLPLTVKEKLKKNLSEKKAEKIAEKVPILKCPAKRTNSLTNKFSKFSKNALKLISKLESSNIGSSDTNSIAPKKTKKGEKFQSKESRSEFLARSRAASSRCREKKKMYILYLEKVNSELSTANENLQLINNLLRQEICDLHAELLKHQNCIVSKKKAEEATSMSETIAAPKAKEELKKANELPTDTTLLINDKSEATLPEPLLDTSTFADPNLNSMDIAEVILDEDSEISEVPLDEGNKPPDIIVRFNSVGNDFPVKLSSDADLDIYIEKAGDDVKQIYSEHSYYFKQPVDIDKRIINYKAIRETFESATPISSEDCKKLENLGLKKSDAFRDITSLNAKVLLEPRTPPPLLLLKPFKKRSLQSKQTEKT